MPTFSRRHGFSSPEAPITVRHDAPSVLREGILMIAKNCGLTGKPLRAVICQALLVAPDNNNWSPGPVWEETLSLMLDCPWPKVYDAAEAIFRALRDHSNATDEHVQFEATLNDYFREHGIGWSMTQGQIEFRGPDALEETVTSAEAALESSGLTDAPRYLKEARSCLSRRPEPNTEDAVSNAMKALEAVARHVAGDPSATLGGIVQSHRHLFSAPLDKTVATAWGFASEQARHGRENQNVRVHEAELIVGLAAAISAYLLRPSGN